jgi:hypothetical protein
VDGQVKLRGTDGVKGDQMWCNAMGVSL